MKNTKPIIIVGAGLAGYSLAREFRKLNKTSPMFIITADDGGFYSKPMLSNAIAQGKNAAQLVTQNAAQMAAQLGATILTGVYVEHIDTNAKKVRTSSGTFEYSSLVLAVGAQPIRLAIQGDASDQVMSVNHIGDYAQFRQRIAKNGAGVRITILGAGLIGCEFADDLAGAGHHVTLVDPNPAPLAALAPPALSKGLHDALMARGIVFRLAASATAISHKKNGTEVLLADGSSFDTDVVLSAVGLRPDLRLAQAAQLKTGRGILVDILGQTSASGVFALGDCTEYAIDSNGGTRTLPYIAPLLVAARAIARTLAGQPTPIDLKPSPIIVKIPSFPLALLPPNVGSRGAWQETQFGEHMVCRFHDSDDVMIGFGVAPHDAGIRQTLLAEVGKPKLIAA